MLLNLSWPRNLWMAGTHTGSGVNMQTIKYLYMFLESAFDQPVHWVPKAHEYIICAYEYPTYDP